MVETYGNILELVCIQLYLVESCWHIYGNEIVSSFTWWNLIGDMGISLYPAFYWWNPIGIYGK